MNITGHPFEVARHPYLIAVGDDTRVRVYRSLAVDPESPGYAPVAQHIAEHGMVLISTEIGPLEGMFGNVEQSHYGTPQTRMHWLATHQEDYQ